VLFHRFQQDRAERILLVDRRPWRERTEPEDFWRGLRDRRTRAGNRRASEKRDKFPSSHSHCLTQVRYGIRSGFNRDAG